MGPPIILGPARAIRRKLSPEKVDTELDSDQKRLRDAI